MLAKGDGKCLGFVVTPNPGRRAVSTFSRAEHQKKNILFGFVGTAGLF
jgi:hypothetical protein